MDVGDYIGFVETEGARFADMAEDGDLGVTIVPCPGWDMRELVRHLGMIHLWAAANVAYPHTDWLDVEDLPDLVRYWPELATAYPAETNPVGWYRDTLTNLIDVLRSAPDDHECFAFLPAPSPLSMWARRQASEIAIHRFDAEQARGTPTHYEPAFAADMLDELLSGFVPRPHSLDIDRPQVFGVHATDIDEHWYVTLAADRATTSRSPVAPADLTLAAPVADLYVLLWNRSPATPVSMTGAADLMDLWHDNIHVRWG